jgi:pyruvate carboxylase subunit A
MSFRIFIANRGEIAIRIARTALENGFVPIGIYTKEDEHSLHRKYLKEDREVSSYLDIEEIVEAAQELGADALHPGYGFLSENPEFAREVARRNIAFIGPSPSAMELSGDKLRAKEIASKLGIPTLPWMIVKDEKDVLEFAREHGFPLLVKAAGGGGGKGIRLLREGDDVGKVIEVASKEAEKAFKDPRIYVEPFLENVKHIEVQILGDGENIIHLFERECSVQRRFQKIVEEAPSPFLTNAERDLITKHAVELATAIRYTNAGTVEMLFDTSSRRYYFMEINARLQVEHPVTEMITGLDIVLKQIEITMYKVLDLKQSNISMRGHAIEARIYAENPLQEEPSTGVVKYYREPSGPGIRVDSSIEAGSKVSAEFDPMIAKLIAWGPDRRTAILRLERGLKEYIIDGILTNIPLLKEIIKHEEFVNGVYTTKLYSQNIDSFRKELEKRIREEALLVTGLQELAGKNIRKFIESSRKSAEEHFERIDKLKRKAWYYYISTRERLRKGR